MRLPGPDYPAPAKLNLFLHVLGRRADGYHLLQSAFTLIDHADRLRLRVRADGEIRRVSELAGVASDEDLVVRAARALKARTGSALGVDIELDKRIPMGSGLGGGSSDAATTLMVLNRLWATNLDATALSTLGAELGADVPFFLFGKPAWAEGTGERLRPLAIPARWYVVLVPPVAIATREIFTAPELTRNTEALKMEDFSASPARKFRNDLEAVVVSRYPVVAEHLAWLERHAPARMTGSGSCVFAAFENAEGARAVMDALPEGMKGFIARGLNDHPLREQQT